MTKFVHKYVVCKGVVSRHGTVQIEDAPAAIRAVVSENLNEFVRRKLGDPPHCAIVKTEHITFRAERIVGRTQRRVSISPGRWSRDAGFVAWWAKTPNIETLSELLKGGSREQNFRQATCILFKLLRFCCSVTIAKNQQINFVSRFARLLDRD